MGNHYYALTANRRRVFRLTTGEEVEVGLMSYVCKEPDNDETYQHHKDDKRMARLYTARMNAAEDRYRGKVPPFLTVAPPKGAPQAAMALYASEGKAVHLDCYWVCASEARLVEGRDGKAVWVEFPATKCWACGDTGRMAGAGGTQRMHGAPVAWVAGMACPRCEGPEAEAAGVALARKQVEEAAEAMVRAAKAREYAEAQRRLSGAQTAAQQAAAAVVAANAALAHANAALAATANAANAARTAAHGK